MEPLQLRLPGFLPPSFREAPLIPVRMLNEYIYCPRLAYLTWAQKEYVNTLDTIEGRAASKRSCRKDKILSAIQGVFSSNEKVVYKSITLSSERLGIFSKIDIVEAAMRKAVPVICKLKKNSHIDSCTLQSERFQLCAQGMLMEEHGYFVESGYIYIFESFETMKINLDESLRAETEIAIGDLKLCMTQKQPPPPLKDSPKCPRCELVTICLPDEINSLKGSQLAPRPIAVPNDEALPLIVQAQRARITKSGDTLVIINSDDSETTARLIDISDVTLFGNISITPMALSALFDREISVSYHSVGGWFRGISHGIGHKNVEIRTMQYRKSFNEVIKLSFSRELVVAKIHNQRTMVRRNYKGNEEQKLLILSELSKLKRIANKTSSLSALLGIEGKAANYYFRAFSKMLNAPKRDKNLLDLSSEKTFRFHGRNRRPPRDPINALLSFGYAILTRQITTSLASVGLDPYRGFFHKPRYGRPSLSLDLMEPFRPIIVDSIILKTVNTGEILPKDFVIGEVGVALTQSGRKKFLNAYERRMSDCVTHPLFHYRLSIRRMLIVQARLFSRYLLDEIPIYPQYLPR